MEHRSSDSLSPIFVVLLGVMSAAVVLTIYHCIIVTWCKPQRGPRRDRVDAAGREIVEAEEFSTAELIPPAVEYAKEVSAEQTTCAVCLCDFKDGETVRLLPGCQHCFHAPCVDMWLLSHTNCPMCRTEMSPALSAVHGATMASVPDASDLERGSTTS